jgi:sterol desaturase/sphingolipid hydroxylase (fatty acid hydroxylase superfamily)
VIGFVLVIFSIEQLWPAERRPVLARGHLLDLGYLVFYAVLVVPLIVLIGSGFAGLLARLEPWLVLPRLPTVPGWCFIVLAVVGIDAVDWLAHLGNHQISALWRLHAVHHSPEELSILTTYRAHPGSSWPAAWASSDATSPSAPGSPTPCWCSRSPPSSCSASPPG